MPDLSKELAKTVKQAFSGETPLDIQGTGSKAFLWNNPDGHQPLDVTGHRGILDYDPAELVLVARAGTPLRDIEKELVKNGQMLGFEPPFTAKGATLGGAVAAGLAGPRRAFSGAARDFLLGARFINGRGEIITSGGKVFKNVAGFDLFRPLSRSMGTLGVILDCSLRLLPEPADQRTLVHEVHDETSALEKMTRWTTDLPCISAAAWDGHNIRIRMSGSSTTIEHGRDRIGGDWLEDNAYWQELNDLELPFFKQAGSLWRVCVAPMSDPLMLEGEQLIDWSGAQRWLIGDETPENVRTRAAELGGYAECYWGDGDIATYHPLDSGLLHLHQRIKRSLDPANILNPGRLYPDL